jgi:hypothetical protein
MQNLIDNAKDWYNSKSPNVQKFIMVVGAIIIIAIISNIISDPAPIT